MKRWLNRLLVLVLAFTAAAVLTDWRVSHRTTGELTLGWRTQPDPASAAHGQAVTVLSRAGRLDVSALRVNVQLEPRLLEGYDLNDTTGVFWRFERHHEPPGQPNRAHFAFRKKSIGYSPRAVMIEGWEVRFPHWAALLVLVLLTSLALLPAWRRRRRRRRGLCEHCGYDLRFSGERCPECGRRRLHVSPPPTPTPEAI